MSLEQLTDREFAREYFAVGMQVAERMFFYVISGFGNDFPAVVRKLQRYETECIRRGYHALPHTEFRLYQRDIAHDTAREPLEHMMQLNGAAPVRSATRIRLFHYKCKDVHCHISWP